MGKRTKSKSRKNVDKTLQTKEVSKASNLLAEVEAMSSEDEDERRETRREILLAESKDESDEEEDAETQALRQAIAEGVFDKLAKMTPKADNHQYPEEGKDKGKEHEDRQEEEHEDHQEEEQENQAHQKEDSDNSVNQSMEPSPIKSNHKALSFTAGELQSNHRRLPWPELFCVTPTTTLPFQDKASRIEVHDDLKREVAFYELALEAAQAAKEHCHTHNISFTRPEDFFAEMVKTDEHMAKVKDRLIFESKKISAVEQRKQNKQNKTRAKELQQRKIADKSKRKKEHMEKVADWAKAAARNRSTGRRDDEDDQYLSTFDSKTSKRKAADTKFGRGGKKAHLARKPDSKSLNDFSSFNKQVYERNATSNKKSGKGIKRPGKRARDSVKSKRK